MFKRFDELGYVIGVFFLIVSLVLLIGYFTSSLLASRINLYSGAGFLLFGLFMVFTKRGK